MEVFSTQQCDNCLDSICIDCSYNSKKCLRCQQEYYITNDSKCVEIPNCLLKRSNRCLKCSNGYLLSENHCQNTSSCLIQTLNGTCQICGIDKLYIIDNGSCKIPDTNSIIVNQNNIIACKSAYITNSNICQKCSDLYKSSEVCENGRPTKCEIEFEMNKSGQCEHNNCSDPNDENGRCTSFINKCTFITNSKCLECYNNLILNNAECHTNDDSQCTNQSLVSCLRCNDSYCFNSSSNRCERCDSNCLTCVINPTYCLSCPLGFYISNNICKTNSELVGICTQFISSGGCAKCAEGYYRNGLDCYKCDLSCSLCNTNSTCLTCNSTNYKTWSGDCKPQNSLIGCDVNVTQYGCTRCKEGYFQVNINECKNCNTTCLTCSSQRSCESCLSSKVLFSSGICVTLSQITKCKEIKNSKCNKCSFWYAPSLDGTYCEKKIVLWVVLVIVLFIIFVLSILVIALIFSMKRILKMIHTKELKRTTTIFEMEKSNVKFISLANNICVSSKELNFNSEVEEIPVNTETKIVFCVGNMSKGVLKIQFTTTTQIDKFTIRVTPEVIMLKKKFACEFSIYSKPKCTCQINNTICIVSKNLKTNVENINEIVMKGITSHSTRIDYDELLEESKLGEGSFGVVYKGKYRGNDVAIKKMKQKEDGKTDSGDKSDDEFEKEVAMLDKFRCDYIIHFYGAVFIPNKMCMVTEFALFGSLQDLMKHKNREKIEMKLRIKLMLDTLNGIIYLHTNGILHRDIKPDNILVISIDFDNNVNAKLTDFGSARNVNLLMTNMTFTKGIGTPVYMAPEMLKRENYKKPADIYSLAITMFECFSWSYAYSKDKFKFPWSTAEFVIKGSRLPKPDDMNQNINDIICGCWKNEPSKRSSLENVKYELETIFNHI
ncbi:protein serine/threonine kinase, putative [Entamoeba invadens IP1]|uniref:Protein serine/threonine kinase, putative n=1 Tax=Entamoeba invadens IP1 TaxID=370355 RepID=A0A0A1TX61_ENTIV|nr:protein serine/threonine kinase, putative [Entamoeba invadens IP1]ELP85853.1 protein serine/threonine kinase, putative [Entamoeba invadens IP1]|eukprot:XP_004185199.1 protein serine/threonine kinase, putative [Entamoeba invadens IP1]